MWMVRVSYVAKLQFPAETGSCGPSSVYSASFARFSESNDALWHGWQRRKEDRLVHEIRGLGVLSFWNA